MTRALRWRCGPHCTSGGAAMPACQWRHPITCLACRADSIVADAEVIRMVLVPGTNHDGRWTVLGQSFGGFCCVTYLSLAPESEPGPV